MRLLCVCARVCVCVCVCVRVCVRLALTGRSALSHIPAFPPHITLCFCRDGTEEELHEALAEEQRRFAGHFKKKHKASVRTASSVLQGGRGGNAAAAGLGMKNKGMNTGGYAKATI
eukprot:GHVU01182892.1.p1 GENE.GHVU01182892.1~~GHVU01182892.1.p1  ORF type:complete len:116 (+),score=22.63 GHVU01182892.1:315-662(+)